MIILCDVDNVISNDNWRLKFIRWDRECRVERFHEYHTASDLDPAHNLDLLQRDKAKVFLITSMPRQYAPYRERWLRQYGVRYERIVYRWPTDIRNSIDYKRSVVQQLRQEGVPLWECVAAYDDRRAVVDMYKEEGLPGIHIQIHEQEHLYHGPA